MTQIVSFIPESIFTLPDIVKICGIVLEIVQNGHNCTFFVVWEQRSEADVLKSNGTVQTVTPHFQVLNSELKIKNLQHTSAGQYLHQLITQKIDLNSK